MLYYRIVASELTNELNKLNLHALNQKVNTEINVIIFSRLIKELFNVLPLKEYISTCNLLNVILWQQEFIVSDREINYRKMYEVLYNYIVYYKSFFNDIDLYGNDYLRYKYYSTFDPNSMIVKYKNGKTLTKQQEILINDEFNLYLTKGYISKRNPILEYLTDRCYDYDIINIANVNNKTKINLGGKL